jgi:uncharacterized membrane protein
MASMAGRLAVLYLAFGLVALMSLAVVVPPYQFGDEVNHFKRIVQLSKGELHGQKIDAGSAGGSINEGVHVTWLAYVHIPTRPEAKVSPVAAERVAPIRWSDHAEAPTDFRNTVVYPPVLYLPSIVAVLVGKAADLRILTTLTLSRAISGATVLLICAGAIWLAGSMAPYLFVILTLPMTLFQMVSVSQDGLMVACAALAVAIFVRRRDNDDHSGWHFVAMTAAIALVAMARFPNAVLAILVLLYPGRSLVARGIALAVIVASVMTWAYIVSDLVPLTVAPGADPGRQISIILADPLRALWIIGRSLNAGLIDTFVGRLGWLDTRLPVAFIAFAVVSLIVAAIASSGLDHRSPGRLTALLVILAAVGGLAIICAAQLVIWTPPGGISIYGVQGRYLTPLVLLLACAIPATKAAHAAFAARHVLLIVSVFAPISIIVMLVAVVQRYY